MHCRWEVNGLLLLLPIINSQHLNNEGNKDVLYIVVERLIIYQKNQ
jgi:hypothetical protein